MAFYYPAMQHVIKIISVLCANCHVPWHAVSNGPAHIFIDVYFRFFYSREILAGLITATKIAILWVKQIRQVPCTLTETALLLLPMYYYLWGKCTSPCCKNGGWLIKPHIYKTLSWGLGQKVNQTFK